MGAHLVFNQALAIAQPDGNITDVEQEHCRQYGA